jgi:hypothetical protein
MKYEQPYGVSDPNAAYINGNPSTGTMGSIPPAASIENPQREIVNFISDCQIAPTDADLHQLSKSVQCGMVNYSDDSGPVNLLVLTMHPPIAALKRGMRFVCVVGTANTSPVKVQVSGLPAVDLLHRDMTKMGAGELLAGSIIDIAFDGTAFQLLSGGSGGGSGQLIFMTAPRSLYVNDGTGDDTFDGSQPLVSSGGGGVGPMKTIGHALTTMAKYNLGGWDFNIYVADGTYHVPSPIQCPLPNGSGNVRVIGNATSPQNVIVQSASGSVIKIVQGGVYYWTGFKFIGNGTPIVGDNGSCMSVAIGTCAMTDCHFGAAQSYHIEAGSAGWIYLGPSGTLTVAGNCAGAHMFAVWGGKIVASIPALPNLNVAVAVSVGTWAIAVDNSVVNIKYQTLAGAAVTAAKYYAAGNGVIDSQGSGVSYLPGNAPGNLATGGQYL